MAIKDTQTVHEQKIASSLNEHADDANLSKEQRDNQKRANQVFSYGGASKRKFVVAESNWGASLEERYSGDYEVGAQTGPSRDNFREVAGKYWGYSKNDTPDQSVVYISKGNWANVARHVPFNISVGEPLYDTSPEKFAGDRNPFFEVKQTIKLTVDKNQFKDATGKYRSDNWYTLIRGVTGEEATGNSGVITEHVDYDYLAFDMNLPFNYSELDNLNLAGPQYAKIRPEYNFYIKEYEEMMRFGAGINESEAIFPNLYALMLEKINEVSNNTLSKHLSLADTIKETGGFFGASKFDIKKHSGQYFDLYGRSFAKTPRNWLDYFTKKFKNIIIPIDNVPLLKDISDKKELFPMFVDMEFSTDKMTEFAQMLSDTMLTNDFMWAMVKDVVNSKGHEIINFMESVETSSVAMQPDGTSTVTMATKTNKRARKVWNVFDWVKNSSLVSFDHGGAIPMTEDEAGRIKASQNSVFLDDGTYSAYDEVNPQKRFFKSLLGVIFVGKLKTFLKSRTKTYNEIIEGHPCHSESVLYRVEKSLADGSGNPTGAAIQNFWFPNTNQIDVLRFVDTQIKYKKRYVYRIYAYQLVVNTKYSYSDSTVWETGASLVVTQRPEVLLIEQEIFADSHIIIDDPPIPPEVEIVPYFGNARKLLFNLNNSVGEYMMDPIPISRSDVADHDELRRSQKVAPGEPVRFKSDDPIGQTGHFEIYRLDTHPQAWSDFENNMIASVANNSNYGRTETLSASSAEYIDNISPNKKYYYTCRTIDSHGHVSNPSAIYEIELVNDEGSVYMTKRIVDFSPMEPKHPTKGMRRLLLIRPTLEQALLNDDLLINVDSAFDVKDIKLGGQGNTVKALQESPWGRKFKFRLVSKKTGKKIDFNVDFKAIMDRKSTLK